MIQIYCLVDPRNGHPFYVGATKVLLKARLSAHVCDTISYSHVIKSCPDRAHGKKHEIIIDLLERNLKPTIDLLYTCDSHTAEYYERFFFSVLISQGFQIVNYQKNINYNKYVKKIVQ